MGTVWMAQQTAPVRRVVALKLIKAGMDSKAFIAGLVSSLSFSPDGRLLVTGSRDHTVKVCDMTQLERE